MGGVLRRWVEFGGGGLGLEEVGGVWKEVSGVWKGVGGVLRRWVGFGREWVEFGKRIVFGK